MPRRVRVINAGDPVPPPRRTVIAMTESPKATTQLTENEKKARRLYATTTSMGFGRSQGLGMIRLAGDVVDTSQAQFYSPQLSTDFLEKPQNLRERRAFYRFFYNTNEIIGQAIDVHSTLPLSKLRLVPPKGKNKHQNQYIYKFFLNMCEEMRLFKTLIEITHEYFLFGNAFIYAQQHDWKDGYSETELAQQAERAHQRSDFLKEKYQIIDKNPLFKGWEKLIVLPPDQVRVRKLPMSDDVTIEYMPDPETRRFMTSDIPYDPNDPTKQIKSNNPRGTQGKGQTQRCGSPGHRS